ncbi:MAG: glycosyltransferase, partial [candidate division Zixibacteria bacterium]|nr:glycosyltransferase [candidate division Zixibacteria bacterium]
MQIKIISNIHSLENIHKDGFTVDLYRYPKSKNNIKVILPIFIKSFKYDYILLNFVAFDVFFLALLKLIVPFNRCKLVVLDLFLTLPESFKDKILWPIKTLLLKKIHRFFVYSKNTTRYQKYYHIKSDKFRYVPYKVNAYDIIQKTKLSDEGYIFCGGKSRRDFRTLIDVMRGLPYPLKIVTVDNAELLEHDSCLEQSNLPSNVEVIRHDGTVELFIKYMANSRLVVLPIKKKVITQTGIAVYLMAMALKKCVIISSGPGVDDVLDSSLAIVVPPEDPEALEAAIERAYNDDQLRNT